MMKKQMKYCFECGRDTPHSYQGRERLSTGMFLPIRAVTAIASLGATEMTTCTCWQCERCGNIIRKG